ncbi:MAG TPA: hypothetical protein DEQ01_02720 [Thermoanaerobacter sp.]|nr:hypothetical protein [Thermoanaerobacter sp.]
MILETDDNQELKIFKSAISSIIPRRPIIFTQSDNNVNRNIFTCSFRVTCYFKSQK